MAKSSALQKLQSQKNKQEEDNVNIQLEPSLDEIMSMKVGDLDFNHNHFNVKLENWGGLDRTGKRRALANHFYPEVNTLNNQVETSTSLEEELEEEATESPKSQNTKPLKTRNTNTDNELAAVLNNIENMNEDEADLEVHRLKENVEFTYFQLGGVLAVIKENKFIGEYNTFREKVEAEFGMKYRKADYLINIYLNIMESGIDFEYLKDIGWTKLKFISHLLTPENVDEWLEKAKEMNTSTLEQEAKEASKSEGKTPSKHTKSDITSMSFKVHPDQRETIDEAINKAKEEVGTDVNAVALEAVCLEFLASGQKKVTVKEPTTEQFFKQVMNKNDNDAEKALSSLLEGSAFEDVFGVPITDISFT